MHACLLCPGRLLAKNQGDITKTNQLLRETSVDAGIALDLLKCVQHMLCPALGLEGFWGPLCWVWRFLAPSLIYPNVRVVLGPAKNLFYFLVIFYRLIQRNERGERRCISLDPGQARKDNPAVKMMSAFMVKISLATVFTFHARMVDRVCE